MKTASSEIRAVAVRAYGAGVSRQQIADILGYHLNSVSRWIREFEREKRLEARPCGHREAVTVLSAIRLEGMTECLVFTGLQP